MILSFVRAVDSYSWFGRASHPVVRTWKPSKKKNCTELHTIIFFPQIHLDFIGDKVLCFFFLLDLTVLLLMNITVH